LRPGRFDEVVEIPEPTDEHRRRIIEHYFDGRIEGLDLDGLCARTEGWSPADIRELFLSVATVGVEHLDAEVERLSRQRGLYAGDACRVYALRNAPLPGTAAKAIR
jgi:SpoVK/Ycf46/Vps4 family AAA+-type ATPase